VTLQNSQFSIHKICKQCKWIHSSSLHSSFNIRVNSLASIFFDEIKGREIAHSLAPALLQRDKKERKESVVPRKFAVGCIGDVAIARAIFSPRNFADGKTTTYRRICRFGMSTRGLSIMERPDGRVADLTKYTRSLPKTAEHRARKPFRAIERSPSAAPERERDYRDIRDSEALVRTASSLERSDRRTVLTYTRARARARLHAEL